MTVLGIHESKSITASNDYEFTISEANGNWQDNMGNYGKSRILFYIENEKNGKAGQKHATHQSHPRDVLANATPLLLEIPSIKKK